MRLTDEQLSRILSEHERGCLAIHGAEDWSHIVLGTVGCAVQVALNEPNQFTAARSNAALATFFDDYYDERMTPEDLLQLLEDGQCA